MDDTPQEPKSCISLAWRSRPESHALANWIVPTGTAPTGRHAPPLPWSDDSKRKKVIMSPTEDEDREDEDWVRIGIPWRDFWWLWLVWLAFLLGTVGAVLAIYAWLP